MSGAANDGERPALDRLHHLSFVVGDLDAAIERFETLLAVPLAERGPVHSRGAEVAIFKLANVNIELVAPATPDSPLHAYLARHGEGFFHLAFGVADVDDAYERLQAAGLPMKGPPYLAYKDWRIAYFDDAVTGGLTSAHIIADDAD
ncbi:methylmalonyl-CoA epimerase [Salinisphaera sp. PC39]|uniref:VOC family protein n=1 Tax=Salinisphaera sp. PC39 TaxID=1304156 RepID=UPI00333E481B